MFFIAGFYWRLLIGGYYGLSVLRVAESHGTGHVGGI